MLMVNFMIAPAPTGPQCSMRRQSCSSSGFARAASAGVGAHQADQLALPRRAGGAADRAFDKGRALAAHLAASATSVAGCTVLISMNSLPLTSPARRPDGPAIDRIDRGRVGENGDDRLAGAGELGRRRGDGCAGRGERLGLVGASDSRP